MSEQIRFDGRVAIVTGAGRGLGRAHALELAARGAKIVVNDLGGDMEGGGADPSVADSVVEEIRSAGGEAAANHDSVASAAGARGIVQTALDAFGTLDIVVNNAGILRKKPFMDHTQEDMEALWAVNLMGSFLVSQAAFPILRDKGYGRFVFTSSPGGLRANPFVTAYASAKAGVIGLAYVVALSGAAHGITANVISPYGGPTRLGKAPHNPQRQGLEQGGDIVSMDVVAPLVAYLSCDECAVNKEIFTIGGGAVARTAIVLGKGWRPADREHFTAEGIRDHLDEVMDLSSFTVPFSSEEEIVEFLGPAMAAVETS